MFFRAWIWDNGIRIHDWARTTKSCGASLGTEKNTTSLSGEPTAWFLLSTVASSEDSRRFRLSANGLEHYCNENPRDDSFFTHRDALGYFSVGGSLLLS